HVVRGDNTDQTGCPCRQSEALGQWIAAWWSGLPKRRANRRQSPRSVCGQSPMPLREVHSRCRSHLLVLYGPSEIDLQFPIQLLNSLVLLACITRDGIGGAEAIQNRAANPMPRVTPQLHSLARVKFGDGIHQSQNAVGAQLIHFHMGREMFANFKSHTPYQRKHFNQHLLPIDVAIEFPFPTPSPSPDGRFPCDDAVPRLDTARLFPCCLSAFDFFSHGFFSLF